MPNDDLLEQLVRRVAKLERRHERLAAQEGSFANFRLLGGNIIAGNDWVNSAIDGVFHSWGGSGYTTATVEKLLPGSDLLVVFWFDAARNTAVSTVADFTVFFDPDDEAGYDSSSFVTKLFISDQPQNVFGWADTTTPISEGPCNITMRTRLTTGGGMRAEGPGTNGFLVFEVPSSLTYV